MTNESEMTKHFLLTVPFIGGELAESIGFKNIMRVLGFLNFVYGPILLFVNIQHNLNVSQKYLIFMI